jgi:tetratricopeptide (TPR) repeat protein
MKVVNKAKTIDPHTVAYFNYKTIGLYLLGKHEEALIVLHEGLQLYPSVLRFYDFLGRIYLTAKRYQEAVEAILTGIRTSTIRPPSMVAYLAAAYEGLKQHTKSKELLDELISRSNANEKGVNIYIVHVLTAMGDFTSAKQWLEKAKETNDVDLIWWTVDPLLSQLREQLNTKKSTTNESDFNGAEKHILELLVAKMPKLNYHNLEHIFDVVNSAVTIAENEKITEEELKLLRLAAYLHDAGFIHSPKNHEEKGSEMAKEILPAFGLTSHQIEIISNMILATRIPQTPATHLEKILCDADLDYLGRDDFYDVGGKLLEELKGLGIVETEREWNLVQKTFLESHRFHTQYSKTVRETAKKQRQLEIAEKLKPKSV